MIKECKHRFSEFSEWEHWTNLYPSKFQSAENEYKECEICGCIIFRYRPEGKENRPE
jgi:hypothetical protein